MASAGKGADLMNSRKSSQDSIAEPFALQCLTNDAGSCKMAGISNFKLVVQFHKIFSIHLNYIYSYSLHKTITKPVFQVGIV